MAAICNLLCTLGYITNSGSGPNFIVGQMEHFYSKIDYRSETDFLAQL